MITIDKNLNLVIPLTRADGSKVYVHSTPVRFESFEKYHLVLAKTFSSFAMNGLDPRSGPSVAAMILKDVAKSTVRVPGMDWWDGEDGVGGAAGLMADMVRMSNVLTSTKDKGWVTEPLQSALDRNLITGEEKSEVMNILTFFTVVSLVAPKMDRPLLVNGMARIYELQAISLNATEFATSLKTSTIAVNTGEKPPA